LFLFRGTVKPDRSDATKHPEDQIIDWLEKTDRDDRLTDEGKDTKGKEKSRQKDRYTCDKQNGLIFPIFFVDVIFFDKREFLYISSPIPDFIIT